MAHMDTKRLGKTAFLFALGLILWLLIGPNIIGLGGEKGTFISFMSWLGVLVSAFGIIVVFFGVSVLTE
jgi:hypothetical protein